MKKITKLFQFFGFSSLTLIFKYIFFTLYRYLNPKGSLIIGIYDYKLQIPMQYDGIGKALFIFKCRELDHKWIIDNELLYGNTVLDLGANIGYYAVMAAKKIGNEGKIYAIEPDPRNIELLKKIFLLIIWIIFSNLNKAQSQIKKIQQSLFYHQKLI